MSFYGHDIDYDVNDPFYGKRTDYGFELVTHV